MLDSYFFPILLRSFRSFLVFRLLYVSFAQLFHYPSLGNLCLMYFSSKNCLNFSLLNAVPGSVRIRFANPFAAVYPTKNSITLSVMGFGKNNAFGQPERLLTEANKLFFCLFAFSNGDCNLTRLPRLVP